MLKRSSGPLIVQADGTVLLDESHPAAEEAREALGRFAELAKRPGTLHHYRIGPLTVWNAASQGMTAEEMLEALRRHARYPVPAGLSEQIRQWVERCGGLELRLGRSGGLLLAGEPRRLEELPKPLLESLGARPSEGGWELPADRRGELKRELTRLGLPVKDRAGYKEGESLDIRLRGELAGGRAFELRDYQAEAVDRFCREDAAGGSGVVVLPCGAGKTVVGAAALARLGRATLVLTSGSTSVRQWKRELLEKTTLRESDIGEYTGDMKQIRPVTVASYQIVAHGKGSSANRTDGGHFDLFGSRDWGLIIYDEVHLLPAPVFRLTAELQATRRLGLTATLVREDGRAEDVFSLIGPKLYELPWRTLERQGWIAGVRCRELRVPLCGSITDQYASADPKTKLRLASSNPAKLEAVSRVLGEHPDRPALIIGQHLDQLRALGEALEAPVLCGSTPGPDREELFRRFNAGELRRLVVSRVANFAVDLPDASLAVQVSGMFGSRQEEAQRIGRLLRPKADGTASLFYTVVSAGTRETEFALKRQLFMVEQGYAYETLEPDFPEKGKGKGKGAGA
ncbi:DEAD/DEAH box helicase [Paenibacillus albicereus]|uniref:DNA 3'-5' helicase n=1 Tax=Paenibacillus albicereus TaxID=2726185 RepID=A0A6H2GY78_9BACL|nr:DNA repair helicase XPB [Paenibacillus albicereus]QJC52393.1 DEAD/DEAH box helicase [Paenibacillus albicereus]